MGKKIRLIRRCHWLLFSMLFIGSGTFGQSVEVNGTVEKGIQAYQKKNYKKALSYFQSINEEGLASSDLYYNIGNCYYQIGELGNAILYYERGLKFAPHDQEIIHNLALANSELETQIEPIPAFFLKQWWINLRQTMGASSWAWIGIIGLWIGLGSLAYMFFAKDVGTRQNLLITSMVALFLCIPAFFLASDQVRVEVNNTEGIVLVPKVSLMIAPEQNSEIIRTLFEGTKMTILGDFNSWRKVRLVDGEIGWIRQNAFEII